MIRINLNIPVTMDNEDYILKKVEKKLNIKKENILNYKIHKKSIDARDKNNILYNYTLDLDLNKKINGYKEIKEEKFNFKIEGIKEIKGRVCIVGSGPAGLFSAYELAKNGYKPLIIERGEKIEKRVKTVENFFETNKLNINSNVQFGEGGAGTFSDGKLNTLVKNKDHLMDEVFDIFIENGADPSIKYLSHPHIGTDRLRNIIINIRNKIISFGGEFMYESKLEDLVIKDNELDGIMVNGKYIKSNALILAVGHSARDTFKMLNNYLSMESKPFAVGVRISHPRDVIDKSEYGKYYKLLPSAYYKLTYHKGSRGIYTFCMCPGGYVINASSEKNRLAINGMSNYKRDSINSNSAVVLTISPKDYGSYLFDGMNLQEKIEKKAYEVGSGYIPIQTFKGLKENKILELGKVKPIFKGKYKLANINDIYPKEVIEDLIDAIDYFGGKIKGFNMDDAIIAAPETRTSSPIRILRDDKLESNIKGIYPSGEGAGYAGGITSAAMDGIKVSCYLAKKYKNVI